MLHHSAANGALGEEYTEGGDWEYSGKTYEKLRLSTIFSRPIVLLFFKQQLGFRIAIRMLEKVVRSVENIDRCISEKA